MLSRGFKRQEAGGAALSRIPLNPTLSPEGRGDKKKKLKMY
jgi:hypothetical protein